MLETVWYALLLVLQAVQQDPVVQQNRIITEVYIGAQLQFELELQGSFIAGGFSDRLGNKDFGDFEMGRRSSRLFSIVPALMVSDPREEKSADNKDEGKTDKTEKPAVPKAFLLDIAPQLKTMGDFNSVPKQDFAYVMPEPETKSGKEQTAPKPKTSPAKTDATKSNPAKDTPTDQVPSFISISKKNGFWVLTLPAADLLMIVRFE